MSKVDMSTVESPSPAAPPLFVANLDDLLGVAPKRRFKVVGPLPVSGASVRIRSLFENELSRHQGNAINESGFSPAKAAAQGRELIALCMVDGDGNPLCGIGQVGRLGKLDSADSSFLYDECAKFVGIKREGIEAIVKNSEGTPVAG